MSGTGTGTQYQHGECTQCGRVVTRVRLTAGKVAQDGREWSRWCDQYGRDWCKASPEDLGEHLAPVTVEGSPQS